MLINDLEIRVCVPSYRRWDRLDVLGVIGGIRVYVCETEYDKYVENWGWNSEVEFVKIKKGVQGNIARVRNYILKNEFADENVDVVCMVDDDLKYVGYWERLRKHKLSKEEFWVFLYKYSLLARELGVFLWGINIGEDKQFYREYTPFSFLSYVGAPFMCFLKGNDCWFDERIPLKEDYDMTLQQLNKHRKVLRVNKFFYVVKQSEQAGGCAWMRNLDEEKRQFELLLKKWGDKIVKYDKTNRSHNLKRRKGERFFDYNPVIKVPIKGV